MTKKPPNPLTEDDNFDGLADLLARTPNSPAVPEDGTIIVNKDREDDSWKSLLLRKGGPGSALVPDSMANLIIVLSHSEKYKGIFVWDCFADEIIVRRCPPWENEANFKVHRLEDDDVVQCQAALEYINLKPSYEKVTRAIERAARQHQIHPVREYFDTLEWDGDARLHEVLIDCCGATTQPGEYTGPIFTKWMVAAVKRIYEPGTKFDHMLVLEGPQNIGKSMFLRTLATFGRDEPREYFTDAIRFETINDLSSIMALQGKIIVEFSELAGMSRKEIEEVKNWITVEKDVVQKKYKNQITTYNRQFVLAGTTNEDTWLRDATGNRRFMPIQCTTKINIDKIREIREQLWAEAVYLYKGGFDTRVDYGSDLEAMASAQQQSRLIEDVWTNQVLDVVDTMRDVTINEVLQMLSVDAARRDEMSARRVTRILRVAGWQRGFKRVKNRNTRVWSNPKYMDEPPATYKLNLEGEDDEV